MPSPGYWNRVAPWQPGLLSADAAGYAAYLASRYRPQEEIQRELSQRGYGLTPQNAGQLASQAGRVRSILDVFQFGAAGDKLERQDLPRNNMLTTAYRFVMQVTFKDERTGTQTHRHVVLELGRLPTLDEMERMAGELGKTLLGRGGSPPTPDSIRNRSVLTDMRVIRAERRT